MCILSLALLPSAGFFSLSMKASPRDPLGAGKSAEIGTQAFQVDFPGGLGAGGTCPYQDRKSTRILENFPVSASPWISRRQTLNSS